MQAFRAPLHLQTHSTFSSQNWRCRNSRSTCPLPHYYGPKRAAQIRLLNFFRRDPEYNLEGLAEQNPAISVQNLRKTFKKRLKGSDKKRQSRNITAVDDLSFTVPRGCMFWLLGPNSSGKSTALRCMSTLVDPNSGKIEYYRIGAVEIASLAGQIVGFVAQSAGLYKDLTGCEHLELFADLAHLYRKSKKHNIEMFIDLLKLEDFIDLHSGVYSGGVIRRLDMAIALLHQPAILVLGELTVGLDIETRMVRERGERN